MIVRHGWQQVMGMVVVAWSLAAPPSAADAAEIKFRRIAPVRGSLVLLGDVADVSGADAEEVDSLRRIELFPAPARGRVQEVRGVELRQLLLLHGVSATEHQFAGAELVAISYPTLPTPAAQKSLASPQSPAFTAAAAEPIVVARRPIPAGGMVRSVDVELQVPTKPVTGLASATAIEKVVGWQTTRALNPGQPVDLRSLRKPILVRQGEAVTIVAKAAGVRVKTTARALSDATLGELVFVESLDSRQKYTAEVTGPREAAVFASGYTVSATAKESP